MAATSAAAVAYGLWCQFHLLKRTDQEEFDDDDTMKTTTFSESHYVPK